MGKGRAETPILTYHKIAPAPPGTTWPGTYVTPETFRAHVTHLARRGLGFATLSEFLDAPDRAGRVVLTFDDGTADFAEGAMPVLVGHGAKATVFLVTGETGGVNRWDSEGGDIEVPLLSAGGIAALARSGGVEFGSHTHTHADLAALPEDDFAREVVRSKDLVAELSGQPCRTFCYPYGRKCEAAMAAVRGAGYDGAVSTEKGINDRDTDRFRLRRIAVRHDTSLPVLVYKLWRARRFGK